MKREGKSVHSPELSDVESAVGLLDGESVVGGWLRRRTGDWGCVGFSGDLNMSGGMKRVGVR